MIRKTFHVTWPFVLGFTVLWLILMFVLLRGRLPVAPDKVVWSRIVNDEYNFSIEYPSKWAADTFGEHGSRGATDMKLEIYQSLLGNFRVFIFQRNHQGEPNLEDVNNWGALKIKEANESFNNRGDPRWQEFDLWEDSIQGHPVLRRRYGNEQFMFEDVYIARSSDMIIITLQSDAPVFESYLDDFNRVVASFEPLE